MWWSERLFGSPDGPAGRIPPRPGASALRADLPESAPDDLPPGARKLPAGPPPLRSRHDAPPRLRAPARLHVLVAASALLLAACGFEPLYDPAGPAAALSGRIEVGVIEGTPGFAMRERLLARLGPAEAPLYQLEVRLAFERTGVALTEQDVTSRFDVTGAAAWTLTPLGAERPALAGEERATTGYSAPGARTGSAYAILSAERDAKERLATLLAERIARRVALAVRAGS